MKVASKKAKGTKLEKVFAKMLVDAGLDETAKRMVLSGAVRGFDGDIYTKLPIHVEAKNQETWSPLEYYKQCELSNPTPARKMNVVVLGRNRIASPFIFMKAGDLIEIMGYALLGGWGK